MIQPTCKYSKVYCKNKEGTLYTCNQEVKNFKNYCEQRFDYGGMKVCNDPTKADESNLETVLLTQEEIDQLFKEK